MPPSTIPHLFCLLPRHFAANILDKYIMHVDCTMVVLCMQLEGKLLALNIEGALSSQCLDKISVS